MLVDDDGPGPPRALKNNDGDQEGVTGARLEVPALGIEQEAEKVAGDDADDGGEERSECTRTDREVQGEEGAVERLREDGLRDERDDEEELFGSGTSLISGFLRLRMAILSRKVDSRGV